MIGYAQTLAPAPQSTPDTIALQRAYAKQLLAGNDQPIHSWSQGVAGIVDALVGGTMARKAGEREAAGEAGAWDSFIPLLTGETSPAGNGMVPGAEVSQAPAPSSPEPDGGMWAGALDAIAPAASGPVGAAPAAAPPAAVGAPALDPAKKAAFIALLKNPFAKPEMKAWALKQLQPATPVPEEYGYTVVDNHLIRTGKHGGSAAEVYAAPGETWVDQQPEADGTVYQRNSKTNETRVSKAGAKPGDKWVDEPPDAKGDVYSRNLTTGETKLVRDSGLLSPAELEQHKVIAKEGAARLGASAMETAQVKRYTDIVDAGHKAQDAVDTFDRMSQLVNDPKFNSGIFANPSLFFKQGIAALGGDPNAAASMEEFAGLSNKTAIESMGGSLGTGFSNADRIFVQEQMPTLSTSIEGNKSRIEINRRIAARKVKMAELADEYVLDPAHPNLDPNFDKQMIAFAKANPLFADLPTAAVGAPAAGAATPPAATYPVPTPAAIQALKDHPELRDQFIQKYGPNARNRWPISSISLTHRLPLGWGRIGLFRGWAGGAPANYFDQFDAPLAGVDPVDIGKSAVSGLTEGAFGVAALPGDVNEMAKRAGHAVAQWYAGKKLDMPPGLDQVIVHALTGKDAKILPTSQDLMELTGVDQMLHKPTTELGRYAETAGSMVPGAVAFGGTRNVADVLENSIRYGIVPGVASEAAGQATQGTPMEPYARTGAAIAAGVIPRGVTPFPTSAERQAAVKTLRNEGVTDLTAGQRTGSRGLQFAENEIGGGPVAGMLERQGEQFTSAALRRIGVERGRATPEVINQAFDDIGVEFRRLTAGNVLNVDAQMIGDVRQSLQTYAGRVSPPSQAPMVRNYAQEIANVAQRGPIDGETYQSLRSRIGADAHAATVPETAHALRDMQGALDDAMERSIAASNPGNLGAFRDVRRQYRNLMAIVPAATKADLGIIKPSDMATAAIGQGKRAYARGQGDFPELAAAGKAIMRPMPQSGTAARVASRAVPAVVGQMLGSTLTGEPMLGGMAGLVGGLALPSAVGRVLMSGPAQGYLGNQLIPRGLASGADRLIQMLMMGSQPDRRASQVEARRALNMATSGPQ